LPWKRTAGTGHGHHDFTEWAGQCQPSIRDPTTSRFAARRSWHPDSSSGAKTILQISHGATLLRTDYPAFRWAFGYGPMAGADRACPDHSGNRGISSRIRAKQRREPRKRGSTELNFTPATVHWLCSSFRRCKTSANGQIRDAHHFPLRNRGCDEALGPDLSSAYA
jgi:hypothetical protein